jgi:transcriptional regulator with XRE-family HTH domain
MDMDTRKISTRPLVVAPEISLHITPEMIRELRMALGQSLSEFGLTLKRAIDTAARKGYSRQYISALERGDPKFVITREIEGAFWGLAALQDDVPAGVGGAVTVKVLAQPGQIVDGAFLRRSLVSKRCARPGCSVIFVGPGKYHDPECGRAWARERRKAARK